MSSALAVEGLCAGYGGVPALRDFSLTVQPGEVHTMLGANGAGKSTALLAIMNAVEPTAGSVTSFGTSLSGRRIEEIARHGVALVPDNRGVFFDLTVAENLRLARAPEGEPAREAALDRFPELRPLLNRPCRLLSGGEQQMLGLAKALVSKPRVLLIDEMSLGLAPLVVQRLLPIIRSLADEHGTAVVLVEQHIDLALQVSDRALVMNRGRVSLAGPAAELMASRAEIEAAYFGQTA